MTWAETESGWEAWGDDDVRYAVVVADVNGLAYLFVDNVEWGSYACGKDAMDAGDEMEGSC